MKQQNQDSDKAISEAFLAIRGNGRNVLSVFGANLHDQSKGQFVVHATDCADCNKLRKLGENESKAEYSSEMEVSADIWSDMIAEGSMTAEDGLGEIHFAPCVKF